jgi:epoxide hydrolase 4
MIEFDDAAVEHRYADLGEVRLHYVEAVPPGPYKGLVVLLHGFPEHWYSWRFQIPALRQAGYRVVAPDLRGYNLSDKPAKVSDYHIKKLARDVAELIAALGEKQAVVVGHDWGSFVAWYLAMHHPDKVKGLAVANGPHPVTFLRFLRTPAQMKKSWYMALFQIPWLPEASAKATDYIMIRRALRRAVRRPGSMTDADLDRYVEALRQPGAFRAMVNYYRASYGPRALRKPPELAKIDLPVLVIWGDADPFIVPEAAQPDPAWVPHARVERLPGAGHFVQLDRPEEVSRLLIDHLDRIG